MSTDYYGLCLDCQAYVTLDRYHCWVCAGGGPMRDGEIVLHADYLRTVRTVRLHKFLAQHCFHRVGVVDEHEVESVATEWHGGAWREEVPWEAETLSAKETWEAYQEGITRKRRALRQWHIR